MHAAKFDKVPHWYKPLFHLLFTDNCTTGLGVTLRQAVRCWYLGRKYGRPSNREAGKPWWHVKHAEVCFNRDKHHVWVWRRIW